MKIIYCSQNGLRHFTDSSLHRTSQPFFVPSADGEWGASICPAVRITRLGMNISEKFAHRYYEAILPFAFFLPVSNLEIPARADERFFLRDSACCAGDICSAGAPDSIHTLSVNGESMDLRFDNLNADSTISIISQGCTLKMGDIIAFGDYSIYTAVHEDTHLTVLYDGAVALDVKIK